MSTSEVKVMERSNDFVLKLKIDAGDGGSQLRRVRLPRILDDEGKINFGDLVGLVVTFVFPQEQNINNGRQGYHVKLTYVDSDEDCVTIGSSDELLDAIEQFSDKGVLRISAEIKQNKKVVSTTPQFFRCNNAASTTPKSVPEVPIKKILEAFVGVLANAIVTLQEGLTTPTSTRATTKNRNSTALVSSCRRKPDIQVAGQQVAAGAAKAGGATIASKAPIDRVESRLFIHGRHTCDSCLVTPILGKRYHAKNLPDYDLCSNCFENYAGTDVVFEAVELDRDRPFQERWRHRHEKRSHARPHCRSESRGNRQDYCQPSAQESNDHDMLAQAHSPSSHQNSFDGALKEAIRRSLQGAAVSDCSPEAEQNELTLELDDPVVEENAEAESLAARSVQREPTDESNNTGPPTVGDASIVVSTQADQTSENASINTSTSMLSETEEDPNVEPLASENAEASKPADVNDSKPNFEQEGTPDSRSSSLVADYKTDTQITPTSPLKSPSKRAAEESFASDAVGSGDVAEAMGGVLDMFADVITEMAEGNDGAASAEDTTSAGESGRLILGSVKTGSVYKDEVESSSSDSWCVVPSEGPNQNQREEIARATEMLGSVLFNSDMKGSSEDAVSILSGSDSVPSSFSVPSSVPWVPSLLTPVPPSDTAHHPWSAHLSQLRELGFDNESMNLEILEKLADKNNANSDEVSVSQVVDELLQEFKHP